MKRPGYDLTWKGIRRQWASPQQRTNSMKKSVPNEQYGSLPVSLLNIINLNQQRSNSAMELPITSLPKIGSGNREQDENIMREWHLYEIEMIRSELRIIISHLVILTKQARQQEELDGVSQDWKFVAMIIDRLCLILFSISMTLFTALTLFSNPTFFKLR